MALRVEALPFRKRLSDPPGAYREFAGSPLEAYLASMAVLIPKGVEVGAEMVDQWRAVCASGTPKRCRK